MGNASPHPSDGSRKNLNRSSGGGSNLTLTIGFSIAHEPNLHGAFTRSRCIDWSGK